MKTNRTIKPNIIISLDCLTPAEQKMFDIGGFFPIHKLLDDYTPETEIRYVQCIFKQISNKKVLFEDDFASGISISFYLKHKVVKTTFASLNYDMVCTLKERCKELGWDKE